jgi:RNA-directed DNA polymerase
LTQIDAFPAKSAIADWLKAGVIEQSRFAPTDEGAPQGGVISPLLLNIALHGMETATGVWYYQRGRGNLETAPDCPVLVRYADDLVALCHSRHQAEQVKTRLAQWLTPRGLAFNEDKTRIVALDDGLDFLGFHVRRYHQRLVLINQQTGRETNPATATHRTAPASRGQRGRGAQEAHSDHPRMGCLLPDRGLERGVLRAR